MQSVPKAPLIVDPSGHGIALSHIHQHAIKVLEGLQNAGFDAFLVGGGVRDLLLGLRPKDFDIVTNALPEQIRKVFPRSRLIGRRFRLVHVHFGREYIEVATYRADHLKAGNEDQDASRYQRIIRDNVYGSNEEDAQRRDFTINALYFNYYDQTIMDRVGGLSDLKANRIKLIGSAEQRYREDPVRLLRAVRFAAKLGFEMDKATEQPLPNLGYLLESVPPARLFDEVLKLLMTGSGQDSYRLLRKYDLWGPLFPASGILSAEQQTLINQGLADTDRRISEGKAVTPAYLFAVLLWASYLAKREEKPFRGESPFDTAYRAATNVILDQSSRLTFPRRFSLQTREIWVMQMRLEERAGKKRALRLMDHRQFRAAYDFMLLRYAAGEPLKNSVSWWKDAVESNPQKSGSSSQGGKKPGSRQPRSRSEQSRTE